MAPLDRAWDDEPWSAPRQPGNRFTFGLKRFSHGCARGADRRHRAAHSHTAVPGDCSRRVPSGRTISAVVPGGTVVVSGSDRSRRATTTRSARTARRDHLAQVMPPPGAGAMRKRRYAGCSSRSWRPATAVQERDDRALAVVVQRGLGAAVVGDPFPVLPHRVVARVDHRQPRRRRVLLQRARTRRRGDRCRRGPAAGTAWRGSQSEVGAGRGSARRAAPPSPSGARRTSSNASAHVVGLCVRRDLPSPSMYSARHASSALTASPSKRRLVVVPEQAADAREQRRAVVQERGGDVALGRSPRTPHRRRRARATRPSGSRCPRGTPRAAPVRTGRRPGRVALVRGRVAA